MAGRGRGERCSRTGLARVCGDVRLGGWRVSCGRAPSGWEWNRSQPCQGATELGFPRPALWQMQGEAACRAGEPSGQGRRTVAEGSWWSRSARPDRSAPSSGPGCGPSPVPPAKRRWRRSGRTACGFRPTPYLRSRMAFSISAWRRWSASSSRVSPSRSVMKP